MKYSHLNEINWENYSIIGFDMDGTLYNEQLFVEQAYEKVAIFLASNTIETANDIYNWMINRWKVQGSSYPFIFSEAIERFHIPSGNEIVKECLNIYRNLNPDLYIEHKIVNLLDQLSAEKELFLVTDGYYELQKRKFSSLQLNRWFLSEDVVFTSKLGREFYKPHHEAIKYISCFQKNISPTLYFGDREIDREFAQNAGFDFVNVKSFYEFWGVK